MIVLSESRIIEIRDEHLPSQGDTFDCIAFARAIEAEVRADCARICRAEISLWSRGIPEARRACEQCALAIEAKGK